MKKFWLAAAAIVASGCVSEIDSGSGLGESNEMLDTNGERGKPEPPMLGQHWAKDAQHNAGSSPDLTYHAGQVMTTGSVITPIYWGTTFAGYSGDKITGLASFYSGLTSSPYGSTNVEYTQAGGGHVSSNATYTGYVVDTTAAPRHAPRTSDIAAEVCRKITNPVANGYYPVYTDTPRGHAGYCAWHSYGTCGNVPVQFGFFFNLDGDPGCDPQDGWTNHSQGLAALANVSGHEWSETITDPRNGGWWDSSGEENADKCAWTFHAPVRLSNATTWKVQGNWSNAAYDHGQTGYALGGCIDGNP